MTITNGYVTLAEAKGRLWPTGAPADTSEDTMLEDIVMDASRKIDADTGRRFFTTAADEVRTYAARWFDCLSTDDIVSITTLKTDEDGDGVYERTWATTDYTLIPLNAALDGKPYSEIHTSREGDYSFPVGNYPGVEITGKFGRANTTVVEARTFTAPLATVAYVDNLASISALTTDDNADGVYETTWTVTTDYVATAVPSTPTTLIVASGAKIFPTAASGVKIVGTWNLTGAPAQIKQACLIRCEIDYWTKNAFGGMGKPQQTLEQLEKLYQEKIAPFVRFVV